MFKIIFSKNAAKDVSKLKAAKLSKKTQDLIDVLRQDPYRMPPPYEKLIGDFKGLYSRRINITHRLVYKVDEKKKIVKILSMWSHYEKN